MRKLDLAFHNLTREELNEAFFCIHKELLDRSSTEIVSLDKGVVASVQYTQKAYTTPYRERNIDLLRVLGDLHSELAPDMNTKQVYEH